MHGFSWTSGKQHLPSGCAQRSVRRTLLWQQEIRNFLQKQERVKQEQSWKMSSAAQPLGWMVTNAWDLPFRRKRGEAPKASYFSSCGSQRPKTQWGRIHGTARGEGNVQKCIQTLHTARNCAPMALELTKSWTTSDFWNILFYFIFLNFNTKSLHIHLQLKILGEEKKKKEISICCKTHPSYIMCIHKICRTDSLLARARLRCNWETETKRACNTK